jgi:Malectin domain
MLAKCLTVLVTVMALAWPVKAFEQLYGINCGGPEHNDSDGLHYEHGFHRNDQDLSWVAPINIGDVPEVDRVIYTHISNSPNTTHQFGYDLPLDGDGLYAVILKFSFARSGTAKHIMTVMLNHDIELLVNIDQREHCGGYGQSCDTYVYFCVTDQIIYYKSHMSVLQEENRSRITFRAVEGRAHMAGVVLVKGTISERRNLVGSNTDELLYFDPLKVPANCAVDEKLNRIIGVSLLKEIVNLENRQLKELVRVQHKFNQLEADRIDAAKDVEIVTDDEVDVSNSVDN